MDQGWGLKAIITKEFSVICLPPRDCMLNKCPRRIKISKLIFKHPTISFFPKTPNNIV